MSRLIVEVCTCTPSSSRSSGARWSVRTSQRPRLAFAWTANVTGARSRDTPVPDASLPLSVPLARRPLLVAWKLVTLAVSESLAEPVDRDVLIDGDVLVDHDDLIDDDVLVDPDDLDDCAIAGGAAATASASAEKTATTSLRTSPSLVDGLIRPSAAALPRLRAWNLPLRHAVAQTSRMLTNVSQEGHVPSGPRSRAAGRRVPRPLRSPDQRARARDRRRPGPVAALDLHSRRSPGTSHRPRTCAPSCTSWRRPQDDVRTGRGHARRRPRAGGAARMTRARSASTAPAIALLLRGRLHHVLQGVGEHRLAVRRRVDAAATRGQHGEQARGARIVRRARRGLGLLERAVAVGDLHVVPSGDPVLECVGDLGQPIERRRWRVGVNEDELAVVDLADRAEHLREVVLEGRKQGVLLGLAPALIGRLLLT